MRPGPSRRRSGASGTRGRRHSAGLRAFLEVVREPTYRRVVIQEGPAVLGYARYREQEERSTFAIVLEIVRSVLTAGEWELDEDMLQTFARIFFGAMSSAGESVSSAEDPEAAAVRVETAIGFILAGFQSLADAGVEIPSGAPADVDYAGFETGASAPASTSEISVAERGQRPSTSAAT